MIQFCICSPGCLSVFFRFRYNLSLVTAVCQQMFAIPASHWSIQFYNRLNSALLLWVTGLIAEKGGRTHMIGKTLVHHQIIAKIAEGFASPDLLVRLLLALGASYPLP